MTDPPKLPPRLSDPPLTIAVGLVVWIVVGVIALVAALSGGHPLGDVFWTCVAGIAVGLFGAAVFTWQRAAARRGSRLAQSGLRRDTGSPEDADTL